MNEDWLHKVHDKMSDYEIDEPDNLWEAIEERLEEKSQQKHPVILIWIKRAVAAAAMLAFVISLSLYMLKDMTESNEAPLLSTAVKTESSSPDNTLATTSKHPTHTTPQALKHYQNRQMTAGVEDHDQSSTTDIIGKPDTELSSGEQNTQISEPDSKDSITDETRHHNVNQSAQNTRYIASTINLSDKSRKHLSFAVFTSGGSGASMNSRSIGRASLSSIGSDKATWEDSPMLGILLFNRGQEIDTEIKHRLPIRAGITFTYNINDRLGIESGVSYANLTTDIREGSNKNYYTGEQKLHYIGIPVNLKYRIFSWQRLDMYASAGVLAEKCVSAKIDKDCFIDYQQKKSESENLSEKPLQWSVNSSVGVQCNLLKSLGIYIEPGVSYYFNDGSEIQTVYKDKPLNFNLNMGLRITFGSSK